MDNKVNFVINGYKFDESSFKLDDYIVYDITPSIDLQNYIMAKMTKNIVPQFEKSMSWMDKYITFPEELITELQDPNSLTYNRIATSICASTKYGIEKIEPGIIINDNKSIMQLKASFSADTLEDDITFHNYTINCSCILIFVFNGLNVSRFNGVNNHKFFSLTKSIIAYF